MPIEVTQSLWLDDDEVQVRAVRASGPGGQHVYKVSGNRLTMDGVLVLVAQEPRSQEMNRQAAVERLLDLIREAAKPPPPPRKKTKPTYASKLRRLEGKTKRSSVKAMRGKP